MAKNGLTRRRRGTTTLLRNQPDVNKLGMSKTALMQEFAHQSTDNIGSKVQVLMFESHIIGKDIKRVSAVLANLKEYQSNLQTQIEGLQSLVAGR